ncbi:MAG TPA: hypothetical protein VG370_16335 [Chloroflexota bacterium]|nr:hypothetical protein [Chloroflexota bacterium]
MSRRYLPVSVLAVVSAVFLAGSVLAHAPSGAIFTTLADGSEVNLNQFPSKEAVYLDGGPGPGAPQTAAGLDDGTYVFQVTDPPGKTLLSTDPARCRQFTVANGVITGVVAQPDGCQHATGTDIDHNATTVQLVPFKDTGNPGGVYKVWVTFLEDYACFPDLSAVDCTAGGKHGFIPSHSKTDNFKVKATKVITEIDVQFFNDLDGDGHLGAGEPQLHGKSAIWTDTLGVSNTKYSYDSQMDPGYVLAHVEALEGGTHLVQIADQDGCKVGLVHVNNMDQPVGPQTLSLVFPDHTNNDLTYFLQVACTVTP